MTQYTQFTSPSAGRYTARREPITVDANDPAAYDKNGTLRDGYCIRIPMQAR